MHATTPTAAFTELNVVSTLSQITDILSQLSTLVKKIESSLSVQTVTGKVAQSNQTPRSDETFPLFGITALAATVSTNIDLSQKNILWAKVKTAGVAITLPIDSCCSVSLVSVDHENYVMKKLPTLIFECFPTPIPVTVASPDPQLKAIGTMQFPINFGLGAGSLLSVLRSCTCVGQCSRAIIIFNPLMNWWIIKISKLPFSIPLRNGYCVTLTTCCYVFHHLHHQLQRQVKM